MADFITGGKFVYSENTLFAIHALLVINSQTSELIIHIQMNGYFYMRMYVTR